MKQKIKLIKEKLNETKVLRVFKKYKYKPRDSNGLFKILKNKSKRNETDLNDIDVSLLDSLIEIGDIGFFRNTNFFVDEWDVSKVKNFNYCFRNCYKFNSDLSGWNTSNAVKMKFMFEYCYVFNQPILNFDMSNVEEMEFFLGYCENFNQDLYSFKFNKKLKNIMFLMDGCVSFNKDVSMWDVSNIENFGFAFRGTKNFKQDLSGWDVSNAKRWENVFKYSLMEKYPELMPEKFRKDYLK